MSRSETKEAGLEGKKGRAKSKRASVHVRNWSRKGSRLKFLSEVFVRKGEEDFGGEYTLGFRRRRRSL